MRKMKDSGVGWIGQIPENWSIAPLKKKMESIVDYRGKTPVKTENGIFLVTAKNIKNGKIEYNSSKEYVKFEEYDNVMQRGYPKISDVLFTTEAPLGEIANVDIEPIALAQRVIKFRGIESEINNYFLKYWMMSAGFQDFLKTLATGSTAIGIKASKLFMLLIVCPSYEEQTHIVNFLDEKCGNIDTIIEKTKEQIEKLKCYRHSVIIEAVTKGLDKTVEMKDSRVEWIGKIPKKWELRKLKTIADIIIGQSPSSEAYNLDGKGFPFLQGNADFTLLFPEERVYTIVANKYSDVNDILLSIRAPVGSKNISDKKYAIGRGLCAIRCVDSYYKFMWFMIDLMKVELELFSTGSTYNSINTDDVKNMRCPFPTYEEQVSIANYLDKKCEQVDETIAKKEDLIDQLIEYKKSLIFEVVTGKMEVVV